MYGKAKLGFGGCIPSPAISFRYMPFSAKVGQRDFRTMIGGCVLTAMLASMTANPFVKFGRPSICEREKLSSDILLQKRSTVTLPRGNAESRGGGGGGKARLMISHTRGEKRTARDKDQESRPMVPGMMPSFRDWPYLEKAGGAAKKTRLATSASFLFAQRAPRKYDHRNRICKFCRVRSVYLHLVVNLFISTCDSVCVCTCVCVCACEVLFAKLCLL
jgi:hypothetical protein